MTLPSIPLPSVPLPPVPARGALICVLALLLAPGPVATAAASGAPRPAASAETLDPSAVAKRALFRKPLDGCHGGATVDCELVVRTVPAKSRLEISDLSCFATVASGGVVRVAMLDSEAANGKRFTASFAPVRTRAGSTQDYVVEARTRFVAMAGETVRLRMHGEVAFQSARCLVVGELLTLK